MAIELPDGRISRTMPEQVGYNSKKIKEIIEFLNQSEIKDKVLNLTDPSGTLTDAQYSIVDQSPSYIVYAGEVYYKAIEDTSYIDFLEIANVIDSSTSLKVGVKRFRIAKSDKSYSSGSVQSFESYTKSQIDSALALKANLSGAAFTGDISTSEKLEIGKYNEEVSDFYTMSSLPDNVVFTPLYVKMARCGKILFFVINFKLENTGETASGNFNANSYISESKISQLSAYTRNSIVDSFGQKLSEGISLGGGMITAFPFMETFNNSNEANNTHIIATLRHVGVNSMAISFNQMSSISANSYKFYTARFFLTLE